MLRVLGEPKWSRTTPGEGDEHGTTWNHYEGIGEFPGLTTWPAIAAPASSRGLSSSPNRLSKAQAIAHFGRGYVVTRYAFDPCEHDEDSEPIYESPNGPLVVVEYRARGNRDFGWR